MKNFYTTKNLSGTEIFFTVANMHKIAQNIYTFQLALVFYHPIFFNKIQVIQVSVLVSVEIITRNRKKQLFKTLNTLFFIFNPFYSYLKKTLYLNTFLLK